MFADFSLKTGIRGFSFAHFAKTKIEKAIWYLIVVLCTCLTCWDVHDTIKLYISYPTGTKVSVVDNATMSFGSPTSCMAFDNHVDNLGFLQNATSVEIGEFLNEFKDILNVNQTLNYYQLNNDKMLVFLSISLAVLTSINRAQFYVQTGYPEINYTWGFFRYEEVANRNFMEGETQAYAAAKWFKSNNISLTKLHKFTGEIMCKMFEVRMWTMSSRNVAELICNRSKVTWIGQQPTSPTGSFVCFKLPANYFDFKFISDITFLNFVVQKQFEVTDFAINSYLSVDFSGEITVFPRSPDILWLGIDAQASVKMTYSNHFRMINRLSNPCASQLQSTCLKQCRDKFIEKWCRCHPVPVDSQYTIKENLEIPECSIENFAVDKTSKCFSIRYEHNPDIVCSNQCVKRCEFGNIMYTYIPSATDPTVNGTYLNVYVDPYSYTLFEEVFLISYKQFLGSLGGNLSLYLGASFVVLFHTITFWISALAQKLIEKEGDVVHVKMEVLQVR